MEDKNRPIIVKRIKKVAGGHHGGSWKVALADFMTAMFAMFLVLWLVTAMDEKQRQGIADYFRAHAVVDVEATYGRPSLIDLEGGSDIPVELGESPQEPLSEDAILEEAERMQRERLEALQVELERAIEQSQALEPYKDHLLLDITPEGLRIQLVDRRNRPMFDLGSAVLRDYADAILRELAQVINNVPNKISIAGHTDAVGFVDDRRYDNWELSADRANAARRTLLAGGTDASRIAQVTGLADTVLFDKENPNNPINRRISITVLNPEAERAISEREGARPFPPEG
ncbi:MAG: flagellar motor protein MotB [Ectothiorhodospiraceae bacterium]|nr:flagellar motor protein MotB [Ectothiorhodospiraceae bacterium]MCH8505104.1 flagellar motor protein MotB [Ectothiorhodospiraceae bacterium]